MSTAPADYCIEPLPHLIRGRLWIHIEQCLRGHDHAVGAVTALCSLFRDECGLHGMGLLRGPQAFQRCDRLALGLFYGSEAGRDGFAVNNDATSTALTQTTPEFGAMECHLITQYIEERLIRIPGLDTCITAVERNL